jgi:hypothetical protein
MQRRNRFAEICVALIVMGLIFTYQSLAQKREALVLFLPFEEGSGKTTQDLSGNENHGEILGGVNWINGRIGNALEFDGKDGYVEVPDDDSLDFTEAITVEFWVKPNADWAGGNWHGLVLKGNMGPEALGAFAPNFFLFQTHPQDGANQIEWVYSHASNDNDFLPSQSALNVGTWYHIAGVIDTADGKWAIYIDGELDSEKDIPNEPLQPDDKKLWIANGWAFFNGAIDEVAVYNKALTQLEIKDDMGGIKQAVASASGKLATRWAEIKTQ